METKKLNQVIKVYNYAVPKDKYGEMKPYFKEYIRYMCEVCLPWDFELTVKIKNDNPNEKWMAYVSVKDKKYILVMRERLAVAFYCGDKKFFNSAILHELRHILDIQKVIDCKYTTASISEKPLRTVDEFYVRKGFKFWTEVNAYYITYSTCRKKNLDSPSKFKFVRYFNKINAQASAIYYTKGKVADEKFDELFDSINDFTYKLGKYFATRYLGLDCQNYCKKTRKTFAYKHLTRFTKKASKIVKKIDKNPYNKKFDANFAKLGKLIYTSFYTPFGMSVLVENGKVIESCSL